MTAGNAMAMTGPDYGGFVVDLNGQQYRYYGMTKDGRLAYVTMRPGGAAFSIQNRELSNLETTEGIKQGYYVGEYGGQSVYADPSGGRNDSVFFYNKGSSSDSSEGSSSSSGSGTSESGNTVTFDNADGSQTAAIVDELLQGNPNISAGKKFNSANTARGRLLNV